MSLETTIIELRSGKLNPSLSAVYPDFEDRSGMIHDRFTRLLMNYSSQFGDTDSIRLFSAPGRVEVGGNHTDHQQGVVLAAAVDCDAVAAVAENGTNEIVVFSEGYGEIRVDISCLTPQESEYNTTASILRGTAARVAELGYPVRGFNAYITSEVLSGSGMSSSAAFEVLIGTVMNGMFCENKISPVEIAKNGKYVENVFFGKPSGLMDQMASAVGGFVSIDFRDPEKPIIKKVDADLNKLGYQLYVIDSGASHADLTEYYASIPVEMGEVSKLFGEKVLREVDEDTFWERIADVRQFTGDRAVLRAIHFFRENQRAIDEAERLQAGDIEGFLKLANESGRSSYMHLQNVIVSGSTKDQAMAFAYAVAGKALNGRGAFRIQGGGFAGTLMAFVPNDDTERFLRVVETALGSGCCLPVQIRSKGCAQIL